MTREDRENLEDNLKELRAQTKLAADSAQVLDFYYATERIEPSWELDERIAAALKKAREIAEEIIRIEKEFIPPWD